MVNEKKINLLKEKSILSSNLTIDLIKSSLTMSYGIGINTHYNYFRGFSCWVDPLNAQ